MALVEKTVLIERSAREMYELVDKVEDYPEFLPWCSSVELVHRNDIRTIAVLHINYHGIKSNFSTRNTKKKFQSMIIEQRTGPFKNLNGSWNFTALSPTACKIEFRLEYEFSNRLLEMAVGPMFNHIAGTFVDSFVQRAQEVHE